MKTKLLPLVQKLVSSVIKKDNCEQPLINMCPRPQYNTIDIENNACGESSSRDYAPFAKFARLGTATCLHCSKNIHVAGSHMYIFHSSRSFVYVCDSCTCNT